MNGVLVSHPHATPVAKSVAAAFARAGRLAAALSGRWPTLRNRMVDPLPAGELRTAPFIELGARAAATVLTGLGAALRSYDALFVAHDARLAISRWPSATAAIYAYEDAALLTFRR